MAFENSLRHSTTTAIRWAPIAVGIVALLAVCLGILFRDGLVEMLIAWNKPEYSHGYLIPFLALYVIGIRATRMVRAADGPSWFAVLALAAVLGLNTVGELSAIQVIIQLSFVLAIWALCAVVFGWGGVRAIWPGLLFLLFMVPLPDILQFNLSNQLQLVSSRLGTAVLRLVGVPVFLQGNVIDLGAYKLQVVEACNGLRYLFPLACFGYLSTILFRGPAWQRMLLLLSSVPIAVFMNSFRIAVTGVLVNQYGTSAADGFMHYFEGWVIFSACLVIMFLEMWGLAIASGRKLDEVFDVEIPVFSSLKLMGRMIRVTPPMLGAIALLLLGIGGSVALSGRSEVLPSHVSLATFPLRLGEWEGTEGEISADELKQIQLTDYTMINYVDTAANSGVELYVAYYDSQRQGASVHSPRACLPGGGWVIEDANEVALKDIGPSEGIVVNRALISADGQRLLVYYWFMQRGRNLTNELLVKWYILADSIMKQRTDGALVRVITPVGDLNDIPRADARLEQFIRKAYPALYYHIPQADAVLPSPSPQASSAAPPPPRDPPPFLNFRSQTPSGQMLRFAAD